MGLTDLLLLGRCEGLGVVEWVMVCVCSSYVVGAGGVDNGIFTEFFGNESCDFWCFCAIWVFIFEACREAANGTGMDEGMSVYK